MGVYIDLEIIPERISPEEWHETYLETLELLRGCPGEMMGMRRETVNSAHRTVYSRKLERHPDEPDKRHWHVVGDFETMETGESFRFYYDIGHYHYRSASDDAELSDEDDIIRCIIEEKKNVRTVLQAKTQGRPYHIPLLAVAMTVEDRFPKYAVAGGDIDIYQARKAQELVKTVLKKDISLPIRADGRRLFQRISVCCKGTDASEIFGEIFRGHRDDQFEIIFAMNDWDTFIQWFSDQMKNYSSPKQFGVIDLLMSWLNTVKDLKTLCELACTDEKGPGFDPGEFASALASTWVTIDKSERDIMDIFLKPEGETDTVASQFGMVILDMGGLKGRNISCYIEQEQALKILDELFPSCSGQIREVFNKKTDEIRKMLSESRESVRGLEKRASIEPEPGDGKSFLLLESAKEASETQDLMLRMAAFSLEKIRSGMMEEFPEIFEESSEHIKDKIVRISDHQGIVLSEDAWKWIDRENDRDLLCFILGLLSIDENEQSFWNMRKGLLENRDLCRDVLNMTYDKKMLEDIAREVEAAKE